MNDDLQKLTDSLISAMHTQCQENAPNFSVSLDAFRGSILKTIGKYLESAAETPLTEEEIRDFMASVQAGDLFMALACAAGNELSWWEFDQQHRTYLERVARHLARTEIDAQEVVDGVYVDLYGTRIVDGERLSKFGSYSGRGSLRGWLRTIIWHSLVDMHRTGHNDVSLDEMTENMGEGATHAAFATASIGGEDAMHDELTCNRYRVASISSLQNAFNSLEDHERLLLMYYHVDNLKLREISRLVEGEDSPLRGWFQRKSQSRQNVPSSRTHESTVMRWLEKSYARILQAFNNELTSVHRLNDDEIKICIELATRDLAGPDIFKSLAVKLPD